MSFDIGGAEGNAFPFEQPGDSVTGKIITLEEVQQTDMDTGELVFWNNNPAQPKMMYRVTLQTELRNDDGDDGKRAVYLRGSRKPESKSSLSAVLAAVKQATGRTALDPGATLTLTYVGDGVASKRGYNPPKQYQAAYQPAAMDLGGAPVAAPPAAAPAAVAAPPAPAAAAPVAGPTPEQVAAMRAAGLDPATVFPGFTG